MVYLHLADVVVCRNGWLMVHCPTHVFRGFICQDRTVQEIMQAEKLADARKKEPLNG